MDKWAETRLVRDFPLLICSHHIFKGNQDARTTLVFFNFISSVGVKSISLQSAFTLPLHHAGLCTHSNKLATVRHVLVNCNRYDKGVNPIIKLESVECISNAMLYKPHLY